jgi:phosphopantothenoylcysteine decarboxylase/phosphopantothenate--cysteine ligase
VKILVTLGGTEEPLDGVRYLSNRSTGSTGRAIAAHFADLGASLTMLHAERVPVGDLPATTAAYRTFDELADLLQRHLAGDYFDAVIHLAAVSDYRLESIEVDGRTLAPGSRGKIGSDHELLLRLAPNPKLIDSLRTWSQNPQLRVVGFKLTDSEDLAEREAAARSLLDRGVAELVVLNDIGEIRDDRHPAVIYSETGVVSRTSDKNELAAALYSLLAAGAPA